jgi:predicted RNA-binding Zn-ribbon protein involved in translation (DUF1610 family)
MAENFNAAQRSELRSAWEAGAKLACPACGAAIATRAIPPKREVPYVRRRVWLICSSCKRSLTIDEEV